MDPAVIALSVAIATLMVPLTYTSIKAAKAGSAIGDALESANKAKRERDVMEREKQVAETEFQQKSRELAKERAAHREQLAAANEELNHVRTLIARCADPDVIDDRMRRVEERLAPRADPRRDDGPRVHRAAPAGGGATGANT